MTSVDELTAEVARLTVERDEAQRTAGAYVQRTQSVEHERDAAQAEAAKLRGELAANEAGLLARFLAWRGIEYGNEACPTCGGAGSRSYPSSAGWMGGAGGQAITSGVCDKCWGSGDASRPWLNLRTLAASRTRDADESCVRCLKCQRCAAACDCTGGPVVEAECTCLEVTGGHQPGCAFNRPRRTRDAATPGEPSPEVWPNGPLDVTKFTCLRCNAKPGEFCTDKLGRSTVSHRDRFDAAAEWRRRHPVTKEGAEVNATPPQRDFHGPEGGMGPLPTRSKKQ